MELIGLHAQFSPEASQSPSHTELDLLFAEQAALRGTVLELQTSCKREAQAFKRESLSLYLQIRRLES
jgi:hypothetical protein